MEFVSRKFQGVHFTASYRIWSDFGVRYWSLLQDFGTLVVSSPLCIVFGVSWCSLLELVARFRDASCHFTASHRIRSEFGVLVVLEFCFVALESLVIDASEGDFVFSPCE